MKGILNRIYSDYVMSNRIREYGDLLVQARCSGYDIIALGDFWKGRDKKEGARPKMVLRHDIDTSPLVALSFSAVERKFGARASYFFRLSTAEPEVMLLLADTGHELGYHYEELATVAKEKGVNREGNREGVLETLVEDARSLFAANLAELRRRTGLPLRIAASHGDFANRALNAPNTLLLSDRGLRASLGIEFEAYDPEIEGRVAFRANDAPYPVLWHPRDPSEAVRAGISPVYVLTHTRHWGRRPLENLREDLKRSVEGLRFRFGVPCCRHRAVHHGEPHLR